MRREGCGQFIRPHLCHPRSLAAPAPRGSLLRTPSFLTGSRVDFPQAAAPQALPQRGSIRGASPSGPAAARSPGAAARPALPPHRGRLSPGRGSGPAVSACRASPGPHPLRHRELLRGRTGRSAPRAARGLQGTVSSRSVGFKGGES